MSGSNRKEVLMGIAFVVVFAVLGSQSIAASERGARVFDQLMRRGILDDYMIDIVQETTGNLVRASDRWSRFQINGRYLPGSINVYLVDSRRMPARRNILDSQELSLVRHKIQKNALCDEETGIIFIDTCLLKDFLASTLLVMDESADLIKAVAFVRVEGTEGIRSLWDPGSNPRLLNRSPRENWLLFFRGMLAFIIGHEMGHIAIGPKTFNFDEPEDFESKEELDARWACPDLLDPGHLAKQSLERKVDNFCMELLIQIPIPDNLSPKRLWYELGAHWYLTYTINQAIVDALFATSSENIHRWMRGLVTPRLYHRLIELDTVKDRGSVQVFYPRTHPVTLERITHSLGMLNRSSYSSYYGQVFETEQEVVLLNMLVHRECEKLKAKGQGMR